jgi:hypothetical protein
VFQAVSIRRICTNLELDTNSAFRHGRCYHPHACNRTSRHELLSRGKALTPVNDTMRVGIELGPATEEKKRTVLAGSLKLSDFGDVRVEVCKSQSECISIELA